MCASVCFPFFLLNICLTLCLPSVCLNVSLTVYVCLFFFSSECVSDCMSPFCPPECFSYCISVFLSTCMCVSVLFISFSTDMLLCASFLLASPSSCSLLRTRSTFNHRFILTTGLSPHYF